jgi:PadR family transcriptional regulator, regulatory protein PadR
LSLEKNSSMTTKRIRSQIARGSGELAILSLLAEQPLYGFEIARQIGERTGGALQFTLASLYPLLYEMEKRGWVEGHWESNDAGRDRRYYRLTRSGKKQLAPLREEWRAFFHALDALAGVSHA